MILATVLVCGGCDDGGDGDTDSSECNLGEYNGDFEITEQSDVAILAGYTGISGDLNTMCPLCTDLSELSCLTTVGRGLFIAGNGVLTTLDGLSALTSVGGGLFILGNDTLANLDGLSALTLVGGNLSIRNNEALNNLDGLSACNSVGGELKIHNNDTLTNLDGLSALTSANNHWWIYENTALPDCEVCELLDQLTGGSTSLSVFENLDDTCTPVPGNCP